MAEHVKRRLIAAKFGVSIALLAFLAGLAEKAHGPERVVPVENAASRLLTTHQVKDHSLLLRDMKFHQVEGYSDFRRADRTTKAMLNNLQNDLSTLSGKVRSTLADAESYANATFLDKAATAANAAKVGGLSADQLVQGHGTVLTGAATVSGSPGHLLAVPGMLEITGSFDGKGETTIVLANTSSEYAMSWVVSQDGVAHSGQLAPGDTFSITLTTGDSATAVLKCNSETSMVSTLNFASLSDVAAGTADLTAQALVGPAS